MWNTCDVEEGASVAVFGLGAVGLSVIQVRPRGSAPGAVGLSCLTLIIVRFSRDYRELRFKNTIIPLPYLHQTDHKPTVAYCVRPYSPCSKCRLSSSMMALIIYCVRPLI